MVEKKPDKCTRAIQRGSSSGPTVFRHVTLLYDQSEKTINSLREHINFTSEDGLTHHGESLRQTANMIELQKESSKRVRLRQNSHDCLCLQDLVQYEKLLKNVKRQKVQVSSLEPNHLDRSLTANSLRSKA